MANELQKLDGGVFIDTKTNEIVHEPPEEGMQIVPEGGVLDDHARGLLKAVAGVDAVDAVDVLETASVDDEVETADEKPVTSKSARGK